jgi:hypothetical protein
MDPGLDSRASSRPFYEFPVRKVEPQPLPREYNGPALSTIYSQFFGQVGTTDCVIRCLWLLLTLSNNPNSRYTYVPYADFYASLSWLEVPGLYMFDLYRLLRRYGFQHRCTIPIATGTYFISAVSTTGAHCVLYSNGTLYDSQRKLPVQLTLEELKALISQRAGDINNYINIAEVL